MNRRLIGVLMTGAGGLLAVAGIIGLIRSGTGTEAAETLPTSTTETSIAPRLLSATTSTALPATTTAPSTLPTSSSTSTSATSSTSTTTTEVPPETVESFVESFGAAIEAGDAEFLFERLHPAVVGGFGSDLCRNWIEDEILTLTDYRLAGIVEGPTTQSFTTPVGTGSIEDAYSAPVSFVFQGQTFESTGGFAPIDGVMHWLGQCR